MNMLIGYIIYFTVGITLSWMFKVFIAKVYKFDPNENPYLFAIGALIMLAWPWVFPFVLTCLFLFFLWSILPH